MKTEHLLPAVKNAALAHDALPEVRIYLTYVSPELAGMWLDRNFQGQRNLSPRTSNKYGAEMLGRQWLFTGDPIRFNREGKLIDGQHRLTAIVDSGETQLLLIIEGLDHDTMAAIDSGRRRSYPDFLRMQGVTNYISVAALVLRMWHWEHGNYLPRVTRIVDAPWAQAIPSVQDMEATRAALEAEGLDFNKAAMFAQNAKAKIGRGCPVMGSILGLTWSLFTLIDPYLREQFFHELLDESKETKPTYAVNALKNLINRKQVGDLTDTEWLHFFIGTWNSWRSGREIGKFQMPPIVGPHSLNYPAGLEERYVG